LNAFGALDWTGLAVWVLAWLGYSLYAERLGKPQANLMASVARFRRIWMREAYLRDPRMTDVALLGNLMHSATFFSSTTLLVLGASFALLGTIERGTEILEVMKTLPFATRVSQELLESKVVLLTLLFVYAFMRFTWSLRQFNLLNIMLGAFPASRDGHEVDEALVATAGRLNELAGLNFTQGLRAYYYAVPMLLWLVNAWLLIGGAVGVTAVLYYMEFRSATVRALGTG
jgi:uncharacterized membrane protein